jgi:hypothetical protein
VETVRREERVLRIPAVAIGVETADAFVKELHTLATERRNSEFEQRLRVAYKSDRASGNPQLDAEARSEDDFVRRNLQNQDFWNAANIPTYQNYVFLAKSGNVIFDGADFEIADLPKDVFYVKARADGINGRFIEVHLKTDFKNFNEARDFSNRQLLVQGDDRNWVTGVYDKLKHLIEAERFQTREFIYSNVTKLFWLTALLFLFAEYRAAKWLNHGFNLSQPLSGTGVLVMFGVLFGTLVAVAELGFAMLTYWFPYFEIEGNISRGRAASRKFVAGVASTIYTGAVVNVIALVFGPTFASWIGH